ncbi:hypothetical protein CJ030_MR6G013309 [Morella rubra]|uniref:Uncharacterized protein n=1 Tax=Morella rubra TaxID=262757 RepID=A0A6A1VI58_9ROSI|nr:hypothetical protein CJ030_MR6G013309 [Morella rubra]
MKMLSLNRSNNASWYKVSNSGYDKIPGEDHGLDYHEWEDEGQEAVLVTDQCAPDHQGRPIDRSGRLTDQGLGRLTDQGPGRLTDQDSPGVLTHKESPAILRLCRKTDQDKQLSGQAPDQFRANMQRDHA